MTAVLDRPVGIDEPFDIDDSVRPCDSNTVDTRERPWKIITRCPRPAEWIYIMKCCGGQALACDPCHEQHLQPTPASKQRHCIHCEARFNTIGDGCSAVYRV